MSNIYIYAINIFVDNHIYNANKDIYSDDFGIQWIVAKMERCTSLWTFILQDDVMEQKYFENHWPFARGINHLEQKDQ